MPAQAGPYESLRSMKLLSKNPSFTQVPVAASRVPRGMSRRVSPMSNAATGVRSRHGEIPEDPRAAHRRFRRKRFGQDGAGFLVLRAYAGGFILERSLGPRRR